MTLRNAVERAMELVADCPLDGVCRYRQAGARVIWCCCGYYLGIEKSRRGVKVKCSYKR